MVFKMGDAYIVVSDDEEVWSEDASYKLDVLMQLFPDKDFEYLKSRALEYSSNDSAFESFVNNALTCDSMPAATRLEDSSPPESKISFLRRRNTGMYR